MSLELYFLRSSEQKIVTDMLYYAQHLDETDKNLEDIQALKIYYDFYGLTAKDLGVYALKDGAIAGAIWSRRLSEYHNSKAYILDDTPVLNLAIKPAFRGEGIATALINQYLSEASKLYKLLSISVPKENISFLEKFGFEVVNGSEHISYAGDKESLIMRKELQKQEEKESFTDFSSCKWLD